MVVSGSDLSQNSLPQGLKTIEYVLECRPRLGKRSEGRPLARWSEQWLADGKVKVSGMPSEKLITSNG